MTACLACGTVAPVEAGLSSAGPDSRSRSWLCAACGWMNTHQAMTWDQFVAANFPDAPAEGPSQ